MRVKTEKSDKKRPGYCECCGVRFDDFAPVSNVGIILLCYDVLLLFLLTSTSRESNTWHMLLIRRIFYHWIHFMMHTRSPHWNSLWILMQKGVWCLYVGVSICVEHEISFFTDAQFDVSACYYKIFSLTV